MEFNKGDRVKLKSGTKEHIIVFLNKEMAELRNTNLEDNGFYYYANLTDLELVKSWEDIKKEALYEVSPAREYDKAKEMKEKIMPTQD